MTKSAFKATAVALLLTANAIGAADSKNTPNLPQSRHVLYYFVRSAAFVSRKADELDHKDGTGASLRRAFSSTTGLSDADRSSVFQVALELDAQFASLDQQAATVIANAKTSRTPGGLIPPPPPELAVLQQQKVAIMNTLGSTLNQRLSSTAKGTIVNYFNRSRAKGNSSSAGTASSQ